MRLRVRQATQGHIADVSGQFRVFLDQPLRRGAEKPHHGYVTDSFGREQPVTLIVETEAFAGEKELGDMAASVGHQLADRPRDDLEPTIGTIALGIDLVVARETTAGADLFERHERIELSGARDEQAAVMQLVKDIECAVGAKLFEHRTLRPVLGLQRGWLVLSRAEIRNAPKELCTENYVSGAIAFRENGPYAGLAHYSPLIEAKLPHPPGRLIRINSCRLVVGRMS
jgi:hypothetical protein